MKPPPAYIANEPGCDEPPSSSDDWKFHLCQQKMVILLSMGITAKYHKTSFVPIRKDFEMASVGYSATYAVPFSLGGP